MNTNKYKLPNDENIYMMYKMMYNNGIDLFEFMNKLTKDRAYNVLYELRYYFIQKEFHMLLSEVHKNNKMLQLIIYSIDNFESDYAIALFGIYPAMLSSIYSKYENYDGYDQMLILEVLALNEYTPVEILEKLSKHASSKIKRAAFRNKKLPAKSIKKYFENKFNYV